MTTFTIDREDNITAHGATVAALPQGTEQFTTEAELGKLAAGWEGARLIEIWNSLAGVKPVRKFTSRKTAVSRIWKAIQVLEASVAAHGPTAGTKKGRPAQKATVPKRAESAKTKTEQIIALLKQPSGATLKALMAATGWQSHSVRGFLSGHLGKKMGLKVKSFERDGERVYALRH
jgi:hypothetical protein